MSKSRKVRERGKLRLSKYFKEFKEGDSVAIVRNLAVRAGFPKRMIGKSGKVKSSRGRYKEVEIKDGGKMKTFIIHPIHLKRLGK